MAGATRILAVAGSREGSWNRKLLRAGVESLQRAGAEVDGLAASLLAEVRRRG